MSANDLLKAYRAKRDFKLTPEPAAESLPASSALTFVVQKHAARNLHYDFRLELLGTLKSWAVPKGPSLNPGTKRMAVQVEDHPIAYADFEGTIPAKQYGAGEVIVWDRGHWTPVGDPALGLQSGKLKFELHGEKLKGGWTLVRMHSGRESDREGHEPWLLIKEKDGYARDDKTFDVLQALPNSVLSGRTLPGDTPARPDVKADKAAKVVIAEKKSSASKLARKAQLSASLPDGAVQAELPASLAPQLATLVNRVPADPAGWVYEIKFDGYRLLSRIEGGSVRCFTRNGHDWTAKLPGLADALARLGIASGWLDGEIAVLNQQGLPEFGALQNAFDSASTADIVYYVFDLPYFDGLDLRQLGLASRRDMLRTVLARTPQDSVRFSEAFEQTPQDLLASIGRLGLEGVIGKRIDSVYVSGRSSDWIKLKSGMRQEFVIGGFTEATGSRTCFGALMLGLHDAEGTLRYVGNVGTGFDDKTLDALAARLSELRTNKSPFADVSTGAKVLKGKKSAVGQWVKPELLAEVSFSAWTAGGQLRHPVFQGLRSDKPATHITREIASVLKTSIEASSAVKNQPAASRPARTSLPASRSVRITHGDRVVDQSTGITKQDLFEYYALVAPLILPHLKARPVSLMRAPAGIAGELFFQKHAQAASIPGIKLLAPELDPGHAPLLEIPSVAALLQTSQFNVIEFHTWNATARAIRKPDRMCFDLDPGTGVGWTEVQEAAQLVRTMLDEMGLAGFLKTSGGKGLHIVVPLTRSHDFDTIKDFSHAMVSHLAHVLPQRLVEKSGPKNRVGKIFVDYLRNGFGATTVSAWSARARPGMGVSVPVAWDELSVLTGGAHWTVQTLASRMSLGNQPWGNYESSRRGLAAAMKTLGFKP